MGKNKYTYTYTIQIIAPDLIGEYFNIFKPSLTPGENFNIQFSIANRRPQYINNYTMEGYHASNSPVKIYLSKDSRIDVFDREIGSYDLGYLAHNAAKVKTVSVTLPPHNDPIWSSDNQKYTIGMIIDPDNNIDEYSWRRGYDHTKHRGSWHGDNNNSNIGIGKDSQPITIKIPSLIDLSLQSFYTDLETTSGNDISVNFQIKNSGNKDLTNIPIDFYLSENSIISNSRDKYLGSYNLSSLSKDSTTGTLKKKLNLPSSSDTFWSGSGKYYIGAIVDPNNNISETDESNNSTHRNIDIDLVPNISI
ncbi:MAG: hypothetical protein O4965_24755, partial [Trichodesmium sp. St19_bin1]|nr:hypothetical protein [Trichodesmium sp. St19_bin1]